MFSSRVLYITIYCLCQNEQTIFSTFNEKEVLSVLVKGKLLKWLTEKLTHWSDFLLTICVYCTSWYNDVTSCSLLNYFSFQVPQGKNSSSESLPTFFTAWAMFLLHYGNTQYSSVTNLDKCMHCSEDGLSQKLNRTPTFCIKMVYLNNHNP